MAENIRVGDHAFVEGGREEFGAVRAVRPEGRAEVVVFVENSGDFAVPLEAVKAVHAQKVVFDLRKLHPRIRAAIGHAHESEEPGL